MDNFSCHPFLILNLTAVGNHLQMMVIIDRHAADCIRKERKIIPKTKKAILAFFQVFYQFDILSLIAFPHFHHKVQQKHSYTRTKSNDKKHKQIHNSSGNTYSSKCIMACKPIYNYYIYYRNNYSNTFSIKRDTAKIVSLSQMYFFIFCSISNIPHFLFQSYLPEIPDFCPFFSVVRNPSCTVKLVLLVKKLLPNLLMPYIP